LRPTTEGAGELMNCSEWSELNKVFKTGILQPDTALLAPASVPPALSKPVVLAIAVRYAASKEVWEGAVIDWIQAGVTAMVARHTAALVARHTAALVEAASTTDAEHSATASPGIVAAVETTYAARFLSAILCCRLLEDTVCTHFSHAVF